MKSKLIIILIIAFVFGCKAQNSDFNQYICNFGNKELPLLLSPNAESWNIFNQGYDKLQGKTYKSISEGIVEKYICSDEFCNPDNGYYRYDYGVKINVSNDFYTVLVRKIKYEGDS